MKRWKALCAYDSTDLFGWQSQSGGNTVQDFIENRLLSIFKAPIRIHGSSRTDSGVHARAQVFHFDAEWAYAPIKLLHALQIGLPRSIQIYDLEPIESHFHARYDAIGKYYAYFIFLGHASPFENRFVYSIPYKTLDIPAMRESAEMLIGKHDFSAFSGKIRSADENPIKDLRRLEIDYQHPRLIIHTEASGYLYKMVRGLVGALIEVGLKKLTPTDIQTILFQKKRTCTIPTAPPQGLFLEKVFYSHPKG